MKTSTTTKTTVALFLFGAGAALMASALFGNPFGLGNNETIFGTATGQPSNDIIKIERPKMLRVSWDCYVDGKFVKSWSVGRGDTGTNDMPSQEHINKIRGDASKGCKDGILYSSATWSG